MENKTSIFILWVLSESLGIRKIAEPGSWWKECFNCGGKISDFSEERQGSSSRGDAQPRLQGLFSCWAVWHPLAWKTKPWAGDVQKVTSRKHRLFSHFRVSSCTSPPALECCDKVLVQNYPRAFLLSSEVKAPPVISCCSLQDLSCPAQSRVALHDLQTCLPI